MSLAVLFRDLGLTDYEPTYRAMQRFTEMRGCETQDEIWFTEHRPVFTQGQAGKAEHVLAPGDIPVVQTDRGGQVTYHGPGQITGYLMLDIERLGCSVRQLVTNIEQACVDTLAHYGITGAPRSDAPGVYVNGAKIASLGLRVRKGLTYHGLALNVDMDLMPFQRINPCGLMGMEMTHMVAFDPNIRLAEVQDVLKACLARSFGVDLHTSDSSVPASA